MKIGNYSVPDFRLAQLIQDTRKVYDSYKGDSIKQPTKNDTFAQLLGYKSARNGAYWTRITALRTCGLIEGRGDVTISPLGKQITYGDETQKAQAQFQAVMNIPLWKELYKRYRFDLPTQDFWAKLANITGCEAPVAKSNEQFVRESFQADTNAIRSIKTMESTREGLTPMDESLEENLAVGNFIKIQAGQTLLRLPFNAQGKKIAIETLQMLEVPEAKSEKTNKGEK